MWGHAAALEDPFIFKAIPTSLPEVPMNLVGTVD